MNETTTKIFIPKPIVEWLLTCQYDFRIFGIRFNDNTITSLDFNEFGYLELEVDSDKVDLYESQVIDTFKSAGFHKNQHPINISYPADNMKTYFFIDPNFNEKKHTPEDYFIVFQSNAPKERIEFYVDRKSYLEDALSKLVNEGFVNRILYRCYEGNLVLDN